jgi:hypothetical protein
VIKLIKTSIEYGGSKEASAADLLTKFTKTTRMIKKNLSQMKISL